MCLFLLTAPRGGSTAAPDKFWALVSIESGLLNIIESVEFSFLRSLAFGFCQFLAALVSSWRFLAFSQSFAFERKARQKYCEKGAPSGVVGSCPRIALPISSGHAALVVCKMVARNL